MQTTRNFYGCLPLLILFCHVQASSGQNKDYLYYQNLVYHAEGDICTHKAPTASFTVFLNRDLSKMLIENAPRWGASSDPNIDGKGAFGVELGNFVDPSPRAGDSVLVTFTCNATKQQGTLSDKITAIPWYYFPRIVTLSRADIPDPPQNVTWNISEKGYRIISWKKEVGHIYAVYRRAFEDTLPSGKSRMLYIRLADRLAAESFTDTAATADKKYGYIVFAINDKGRISPHSTEVTEASQTFHLTAIPRATTVLLAWEPLHEKNKNIKGYNLYRWKPEATAGELIAYVGLDTFYMDSRLTKSTSYVYEVRGRINETTEFGESDEVVVTTLSSGQGFYTYANLKVAVVIYKNTNRGSISNADVAKIHTMLEAGRLFYWRNSGMKLNTELTYYDIDSYKAFDNPNNYYLTETVDDLKAFGVMNTQYDIIFRICPAIGGYWSFGVIDLNFSGPRRSTGFSHSDWPVGTGVQFQQSLPGIDFGLTWIYVHEVQHAIDAVYAANDHPEMYHGDVPWEFPVPCGEHFDFQAKIFRHFTAYEDLMSNWGDIYEAVDADQDGFPDDDAFVALDERRFGSASVAADTDRDGYSDKQEATDGSYSGSDPRDSDTDADGVLDGSDDYVRFPLKTTIGQITPKIDGVIEAGWPVINDTVSYTQVGYAPKLAMCYDADSLYLALYLPNIALPELSFDFQADGWWASSGNTYMKINISNGTFSEFRSWDASPEVKSYALSQGGAGGMMDDDPNYQSRFGRRVIYPNRVKLKVKLEWPIVQIEMAIPKTPYAGLNLRPGDSIGLNIKYIKVNNDPNQWASTFDQYNFAYVTLGKSTDVMTNGTDTGGVKQFTLHQNYPNPFNPQTEIRFDIAQHGHVLLNVYNLQGQQIARLIDATLRPGSYRAIFNATNLPSGLYFYRLRTGSFDATKRMLVIQ